MSSKKRSSKKSQLKTVSEDPNNEKLMFEKVVGNDVSVDDILAISKYNKISIPEFQLQLVIVTEAVSKKNENFIKVKKFSSVKDTRTFTIYEVDEDEVKVDTEDVLLKIHNEAFQITSASQSQAQSSGTKKKSSGQKSNKKDKNQDVKFTYQISKQLRQEIQKAIQKNEEENDKNLSEEIEEEEDDEEENDEQEKKVEKKDQKAAKNKKETPKQQPQQKSKIDENQQLKPPSKSANKNQKKSDKKNLQKESSEEESVSASEAASEKSKNESLSQKSSQSASQSNLAQFSESSSWTSSSDEESDTEIQKKQKANLKKLQQKPIMLVTKKQQKTEIELEEEEKKNEEATPNKRGRKKKEGDDLGLKAVPVKKKVKKSLSEEKQSAKKAEEDEDLVNDDKDNDQKSMDQEKEDENEDGKKKRKKRCPKKKSEKEGGEDNNDEPKAKKQRKPRAASTKPKKEKPKPTEFKKGKWNPQIENLAGEFQQKNSKSSEFVTHCCVKCTNKELIRAINTENYELQTQILHSQYKISNLYEHWGPENDLNAIELIFQKKDLKALKIFLQAYTFLQNPNYEDEDKEELERQQKLQSSKKSLTKKNSKMLDEDEEKKPEGNEKKLKKLRLTTTPPCQLKKIDTGYNPKYAYGVATRKVNISRGGKEGNNAFTHDLAEKNTFSDEILNRIMQNCSDLHMFDLLRAQNLDYWDDTLINKFNVPASAGNWQLCASLIKLANRRGGFGFNDLHLNVLQAKNAADLGQFKRVSVHKKSLNFSIQPLHLACLNPNGEILKAILDMGEIDLIANDQFMNKPIHYAAANRISSMPMKLLIESGQNANEPNQEGLTPLMIACKYGCVEVIKLLLENEQKSSPKTKNALGYNAVHYAAQYGHLDALKVFHEKYFQRKVSFLKMPGPSRQTPLHLAAIFGHYEIAKFLLEVGRSPILGKDKLKRTALLLACKNGNLDIVSLLLQQGSLFDYPDSSQNTPLHYAAAYGFPEIIQELVRAGADINLKNAWNISPLAIAMQKNHQICIKQILEYPSSDVNNTIDDFGRTLISIAINDKECLSGKGLEYIKFLLEKKNADLTINDSSGKSPIYYATQKIFNLDLSNETQINLLMKLFDMLLDTHSAQVLEKEKQQQLQQQSPLDLNASLLSSNQQQQSLFSNQLQLPTSQLSQKQIDFQEQQYYSKLSASPLHYLCDDLIGDEVEDAQKLNQLQYAQLAGGQEERNQKTKEMREKMKWKIQKKQSAIKQMLEYFVSKNYSFSQQDQQGLTPLHKACNLMSKVNNQEQKEYVKDLIEYILTQEQHSKFKKATHVADRQNKNTPLHQLLIANLGNQQFSPQSVEDEEQYLDKNLKNKDDETEKEKLKEERKKKVEQFEEDKNWIKKLIIDLFIIKAGADINKKNLKGQSSLHLLILSFNQFPQFVRNNEEVLVEIIKELVINYKGDLNQPDIDGKTSFFIAVDQLLVNNRFEKRGQFIFDFIKFLLLEGKGDPNFQIKYKILKENQQNQHNLVTMFQQQPDQKIELYEYLNGENAFHQLLKQIPQVIQQRSQDIQNKKNEILKEKEKKQQEKEQELDVTGKKKQKRLVDDDLLYQNQQMFFNQSIEEDDDFIIHKPRTRGGKTRGRGRGRGGRGGKANFNNSFGGQQDYFQQQQYQQQQQQYWTPQFFHSLTSEQYQSLIRLFIEKGLANINCIQQKSLTDKTSLLHILVETGQTYNYQDNLMILQILEYFLNCGADVNFQNTQGLSAFLIFCRELKKVSLSQYKKLDDLIKKQQQKEQGLILEDNDLEEYFLNGEKEILNIRTINFIDKFLKCGANPNLENGVTLRTAFDTFIENILPEKQVEEQVYYQKIKLFLDNKANPNQKNKQKLTPFHYLCQNVLQNFKQKKDEKVQKLMELEEKQDTMDVELTEEQIQQKKIEEIDKQIKQFEEKFKKLDDLETVRTLKLNANIDDEAIDQNQELAEETYLIKILKLFIYQYKADPNLVVESSYEEPEQKPQYPQYTQPSIQGFGMATPLQQLQGGLFGLGGGFGGFNQMQNFGAAVGGFQFGGIQNNSMLDTPVQQQQAKQFVEREGNTPFHNFCKYVANTIPLKEVQKILEIFFDKNANPNIQDNIQKETPFHCFVKNLKKFNSNNRKLTLNELELDIQKQQIIIIEQFLKHGANPTILDKQGFNIFHYLCINQSLCDDLFTPLFFNIWKSYNQSKLNIKIDQHLEKKLIEQQNINLFSANIFGQSACTQEKKSKLKYTIYWRNVLESSSSGYQEKTPFQILYQRKSCNILKLILNNKIEELFQKNLARDSTVLHDMANLLRHNNGSEVFLLAVKIIEQFEQAEKKTFIKPTNLTILPQQKLNEEQTKVFDENFDKQFGYPSIDASTNQTLEQIQKQKEEQELRSLEEEQLHFQDINRFTECDIDGFTPFLRIFEHFMYRNSKRAAKIDLEYEQKFIDLLKEMKKHLKDSDINATVKMKKYYREAYKNLTRSKLRLEKMEQILREKSLDRFLSLIANPKLVLDQTSQEKQYILFKESVLIMEKEWMKNTMVQKNYKADFAGFSILHFFMQAPSLNILKFLQNEFPNLDPNKKDLKGNTPLFYFFENNAEKFNNPENNEIPQNIDSFLILKEFLKFKQCDATMINGTKENYEAPIITVALRGELQYVKILIDHSKATLNVLNSKDICPLNYWIHQRNENMIEQMLKLGADPNFKDSEGRNALHHAVNNPKQNADSSFELEEILLKYKADINARDKKGRTPLHYVFLNIGHGYNNEEQYDTSNLDPVEKVSSLLAVKNQDINLQDIYKRTALHYAGMRGSSIAAMYLLENHAKKDLKDTENNTALSIGFINGHMNFVTILIHNNDNVNTKAHLVKRENIDVNNPKNNKVFYNNRWNEETAPDGISLFKIAIRYGWEGVAYLLVKHGFPFRPAIEDSINEHKFKLVQTLLTKISQDEIGIVKEVNKDNQNLFHSLAIQSKTATKDLLQKITNSLVRKGLKFDDQDNQGKTPLHYTFENQAKVLAKILIVDLKCKLDLKDKQGNTVMHSLLNSLLSNQNTKFLGLANKLVQQQKFNLDEQGFNGQTILHLAAEVHGLYGKQSVQNQKLKRLIYRLFEQQQVINPNILNKFDITSLYYASKSQFQILFYHTLNHHYQQFNCMGHQELSDKYCNSLLQEIVHSNNFSFFKSVLESSSKSHNFQYKINPNLQNSMKVAKFEKINVGTLQEEEKISFHWQPHDTVLHMLIKENRRDMLRTFLGLQLPDILLEDKEKIKFQKLSQQGALKPITDIFSEPVNPNIQNLEGQTALHLLAAMKPLNISESIQNEQFFFELLKYGGDLNIQDKTGQTVLHKLVISNRLELLKKIDKQILEKINTKIVDQNGKSTLHLACEKDNALDLIQFLIKIDNGAMINVQDKQNKTPLFIACEAFYSQSKDDFEYHYYDVQMTEEEIEKQRKKLEQQQQSQQYQQYYSPFGGMFQQNQQYLPQQKQFKNQQFAMGNAFYQPQIETVNKLFTNQNLDLPEVMDNKIKTTKKMRKKNYTKCKFRQIVRFLLDNGADPNIKKVDKIKETVEKFIFGISQQEIIEKVQETSVLIEAVKKEFKILIETLMNIQIVLPNGTNVTNIAEQDGQGGLKEDLMELESNQNKLIKIDMNIQNEKGETPLHFAVTQKSKKMVKLLMNNQENINPNIKTRLDLGGKSPLYLATIETKQLEIVKKLLFKQLPITKKSQEKKDKKEDQNDKIILHKYIDAWVTDAKGNTCLHTLLKKNRSGNFQVEAVEYKIMKALLKAMNHDSKNTEKFLTCKNMKGRTPITILLNSFLRKQHINYEAFKNGFIQFAKYNAANELLNQNFIKISIKNNLTLKKEDIRLQLKVKRLPEDFNQISFKNFSDYTEYVQQELNKLQQKQQQKQKQLQQEQTESQYKVLTMSFQDQQKQQLKLSEELKKKNDQFLREIEKEKKEIETEDVFEVSPLIYFALLERERGVLGLNNTSALSNQKIKVFKNCLKSIPDIVFQQDPNKQSILIHFIQENNLELLNVCLDTVDHLLHNNEQTTKQKLKIMVDGKGWSPIHYAVCPVEYGSYENDEMLEKLSKYFDVNQKDNKNKPPLYYALLQDSGKMKEKLLSLNALNMQINIRRGVTSLVGKCRWPEYDVNFIKDGHEYSEWAADQDQKNQKLLEELRFNSLTKEQQEMDIQLRKKITKNRVQPDRNATRKGYKEGQDLEVLYEDETDPLSAYDLLMTKVDIRNGLYSENVFYKMQILHEKLRNVYILFTRWGRIGDNGQYQQTPYPTSNEAIVEFKKIFKQKSGNNWEERFEFDKKPKKYQLMMMTLKKPNPKQYLQPLGAFNLSHQKRLLKQQIENYEKTINQKQQQFGGFGNSYQSLGQQTQIEALKNQILALSQRQKLFKKSRLDKRVMSVLNSISNTQMFQREFDQYGISQEFCPLANLTREHLVQAKDCLLQISDLLDELETTKQYQHESNMFLGGTGVPGSDDNKTAVAGGDQILQTTSFAQSKKAQEKLDIDDNEIDEFDEEEPKKNVFRDKDDEEISNDDDDDDDDDKPKKPKKKLAKKAIKRIIKTTKRKLLPEEDEDIVNDDLEEEKSEEQEQQYDEILSEKPQNMMQDMQVSQQQANEDTGMSTSKYIEEVIRIREEIAVKTSRFYELIPLDKFKTEAIPPLASKDEVNKMLSMINNLLDFELSAKILLGALNIIHNPANPLKIHPLDYIYTSLNIRMLPLNLRDAEYKLILQYISKSENIDVFQKQTVKNIFAIERKGEAEKISKWKNTENKLFLFHGTKTANIMGILAQGLRIAPPEAAVTGWMFGRGVYFADVFQKSLAYCYSSGQDKYKYMFICEVVVGKPDECDSLHYTSEVQSPYNSILALGTQYPNPKQKIILPNNAAIPCGDLVEYDPETDPKNIELKAKNKPIAERHVAHNEFIIFDESQIRMRYMIQMYNNQSGNHDNDSDYEEDENDYNQDQMEIENNKSNKKKGFQKKITEIEEDEDQSNDLGDIFNFDME